MSASDKGYTIDTTYDDQLKSPMNLALHWSEEAQCWEVIVRFRGKLLGVTQVVNLNDIAMTVYDYVSIASDVPITPGSELENSLLVRDFHLIVERVREVITDFGQLGTSDAKNEVTALNTIELIDEVVNDEDVLEPLRLKASVEDRAQEVIHDWICSCPGGDDATAPCPNSARVARLIEDLDGVGVLRRGEDPKPREVTT